MARLMDKVTNGNIEMKWSSTVDEILGDEKEVTQLRLKSTINDELETIDVNGVFIAIGHLPNTKPFEGILDLDANGYLVPSSGSMVKTKIPGVFVAGDCADHVYRQAITAAGMGCQSAIEAERWLAESN